MDWLKDLDPVKVLIWVAPGAFIAMFRSFFLKGSFPTIGKDDLSAFVLGSVVYRFLILGFLTQEDIAKLSTGGWFWFFVLGVAPCILGFLVGIFEGSDIVGKVMRRCGLAMPTPTPSAWDTMFRGLPTGAFLIVTLQDGTIFGGRWTKTGLSSSASSNSEILDLFIGEIGTVDPKTGRYTATVPQRGMYIAAEQIRDIEVIIKAKQ